MGNFFYFLALEAAKAKIGDYLPGVLRGLGRDRVKFLVDNNIKLGDIPDFRNKIFGFLPDAISQLHMLDVSPDDAVIDFAKVVIELIQEKCPEFSFVTQSWIIMSLRGILIDSGKSTIRG